MSELPPGIQWIFTWADAVQRQGERISTADDLLSAQPDALLFAVALGGLLQTAELELGKGNKAIQDFKRAVPNSKDVRDIVSHLDEYSQGTGNLQKAGRAGRQVILEREPDGTISITVFGFELTITTAVVAAAKLAEAVLDNRTN